MKKNIEHEVSSGNVFADLGLPDADELLIKAGIVSQINDLINQKKLSQKDAGKLLNIDKSKLLDLSLGKLSQLSLVELFKFLNILDQDVVINIKPKTKSKKQANIRVSTPSRTHSKERIIVPTKNSNVVSIQAKRKK